MKFVLLAVGAVASKTAPPPPEFDPKECNDKMQSFHNMNNLEFALYDGLCKDFTACKER